MILPTPRAFRLVFACLFALLLTAGLLTTLPAQAQEGTPVTSGPLVPLGRSCIGLVPGDQTPLCCAAGYVLVDGEPVAGAQVTISSDEGTLVVQTASSEEIIDPYYAASLSDTLKVLPGDWVTFTVTYDEFTVVRAHQAITGGQQVDLVINTFEGGRFEGTDLVSDRIRLFHRPTVNVKANDDDVANIRVQPKLAVDSSDKLHLVWVDNRNDPNLRQLYSSYSTNQGQSWSPNFQLSNFDRNILRLEDLSNLVTDANGTLYLAWSDYNSTESELKSYLAKSIDGGLTWSTPIRIGNSDQIQSMFPTLAFDRDGYLIVAWVDYRDGKLDIYFAKSTDGGASWSNSVKVNNDSDRMEFADLVYLTPSLVVGNDGTLMLAWTDNRNDHLDIYFARSEDGGQSWLQPNIRIHDDGLNDQLTPVLAVGEHDKLYAVWADERDGSSKVYFANSSDGGLSWSDSDLVNPPSDMSTQHDPQVIISEGDIYVAWREHRNEKSNLLLARSRDEGQSWRLIGQVNEVDDKLHVYEGFPYARPGLTVDSSGNLYFAWPDLRNHHTHEDIYTARWPDPNNFYSEGTYTSQVYDAREVVGWRTLEWGEELPDGTAITVEVRTGNTPTAGDNWSEWQTFTSLPADLSLLPHGQYLQWRARLSSTRSSNTPLLAPITLTVESVQSPNVTPKIQTDLGAIIFRAEEGAQNPAAQRLQIRNGGRGTFAWTATTETPWLQLGATSGMANETIDVQADSSALPVGIHRGELILSAPGVPNSPQTIEVILSVTEPGQSVWTLMFYVAADNDLAFGLKNKQLSLQEAAEHANLNILMLIDLAGSDDTQLYQVLPDGLLTYAPDNVPWLASEMDMGDPETLRQFVSWAQEKYPADLTYLNIADHGKGTQGIAWDEQASSFLPVSELSQALKAATNGEPIDVLHYDACLMAMFEGAYDVRGAADYLVASQNLAWSLFAFTDYAHAAAERDSARDFASDIARLYHESLTIEPDTYPETISAIDLSKIEAVNERLNELVAALDPNDPNLDVAALREARTHTQKFDSRNYYQIDNQDEYLDLYDLALKIQERIADQSVQDRAQALMASIQEAVIAEHHFSDQAYGHYWDVKNAHGLSIYFPSAPSIGEESDYQRYLNDQLFAFTQNSEYDELLADVLSGLTPIDGPNVPPPPPPPVYPFTGTQALDMSPGWHLISIPGELSNSDVSDVLQPIEGNYEVAYAHDACDASDPWKIYDPNGPPYANDLNEIDRTKGIWVNMTLTDTLVMTSTVPVSTTIPLCAGWNLVGYPSAHERPIVEALETITGTYSIIYAYDATDLAQQWKKYDPNAPAFANTLEAMKPGWGYWIKVDQDVQWTIVNE